MWKNCDIMKEKGEISMSIDRLQEKIRKAKNPSLLDFDITRQQLPPHLLAEERTFEKAYARFCIELMEALHGFIPAVKFNFGGFALMGTEGLAALSRVLDSARRLGYYVILEIPEALSAQRAGSNARLLFSPECPWYFDGILLTSYIGSDGIKPYAAQLEETGKSLFVAVRTANRSAMELQDLLTGGRNVFDAKADVANRFKNTQATKSGYDRIGLVGPGSSAAILRKLREKYKNLFIMVDGYDYPNANAKNCAEAVDKVGHGAIVCAGTSITAAWQIAENDGTDFLEDAKEAADRMKKNLARYFTVL